jgi:hypothetical protein
MISKEISEDILKTSIYNPFIMNLVKKLICYSTLNDRNFLQLALINDLRLMKHRDDGVKFNQVAEEFCNLGYAKKFAEIYQSGMKHDELYEKVFNKPISDIELNGYISEDK